MAGMTLPEDLAGLRMELSQCTTAATYATSLQVRCWVSAVAFQQSVCFSASKAGWSCPHSMSKGIPCGWHAAFDRCV